MKLSILAATANVSTCGSRAAGAKRHASKPWPGASQNEPPLPDHDYHVMSDAELSATIKEASQAAIAMRGVNAGSQRECLKQVDGACIILNYRARGDGFATER